VRLYSTYTKALTFENLCKAGFLFANNNDPLAIPDKYINDAKKLSDWAEKYRSDPLAGAGHSPSNSPSPSPSRAHGSFSHTHSLSWVEV